MRRNKFHHWKLCQVLPVPSSSLLPLPVFRLNFVHDDTLHKVPEDRRPVKQVADLARVGIQQGKTEQETFEKAVCTVFQKKENAEDGLRAGGGQLP